MLTTERTTLPIVPLTLISTLSNTLIDTPAPTSPTIPPFSKTPGYNSSSNATSQYPRIKTLTVTLNAAESAGCTTDAAGMAWCWSKAATPTATADSTADSKPASSALSGFESVARSTATRSVNGGGAEATGIAEGEDRYHGGWYGEDGHAADAEGEEYGDGDGDGSDDEDDHHHDNEDEDEDEEEEEEDEEDEEDHRKWWQWWTGYAGGKTSTSESETATLSTTFSPLDLGSFSSCLTTQGTTLCAIAKRTPVAVSAVVTAHAVLPVERGVQGVQGVGWH